MVLVLTLLGDTYNSCPQQKGIAHIIHYFMLVINYCAGLPSTVYNRSNSVLFVEVIMQMT